MELEKGRVKYEIGIKTKIKIKYNKYKIKKNKEHREKQVLIWKTAVQCMYVSPRRGPLDDPLQTFKHEDSGRERPHSVNQLWPRINVVCKSGWDVINLLNNTQSCTSATAPFWMWRRQNHFLLFL